MTGTESDRPGTPFLKVVNGDATPEEIAALVAVFAALGSASGAPARRARPAWSLPARGLRRTHLSGAGGWRASGLLR
ncbi:MAG: acyl-CoA carboxylase subunit epsilon [Nocardioides sp.]|nr:acyl-CoA carboxylase subunit epsilon [Nocardioides sp.]